jgi:glutaredoxin
MKKILVLAILAFAGYKFYQDGFSVFSSKGAFDKQGKPLVVLFVGPGCADYCEKVRTVLQNRNVTFEEIDVAGPDGAPVGNKYGVTSFPTTIIGSQEVRGDDILRITTVLAETYGKEVLTRKESRIMDNHFDADGRAQVVMYATKWCQYCKKQRAYFAEHNISYEEIDVEESEENTSLYNALEGNGYPLTYVGYRRFPGYQEAGIVTAIAELEKAGPRH